MKSAFLDYIFNMENLGFPFDNIRYVRENERAEKENRQPMHLSDIISVVRKSDKYRLFLNLMNGIDEGLLYQSTTHGERHNERVAIFAAAIGILENVSEEDFRIVVEAAKYHDIGRENDEEDEAHGRRSAELIDKNNIGSELSDESRKILMAICEGHSRDDVEFDAIMEEYGIKDIKRCKKMYAILKDADALDRVRLRSDGLDPSYLRTKESKNMVSAAYEMYYNYGLISKEIEEEQEIELPEMVEYEDDVMPLDDSKKELLRKQWRLIRRFSKFRTNPSKIETDENGRIVLKKGTLIHGTSGISRKMMESIAKTGILCGEFVGIWEDAETYYCADFIRIPEDQTLDEFQKSGIASAGGRIPLGSSRKFNNIGFIISPDPMLDEILEEDVYTEESSETAKSFLNQKSEVVQKYSGSGRGLVSAVVGGIPASCISGIIVGKHLEENEEAIEFLKKTFPGRYIIDPDGIVIYNPSIQGIDEETQKQILQFQMDNAKIEAGNNELRQTIGSTKKYQDKEQDEIDRIIELLKSKRDVETLEIIYMKILKFKSLPPWLERMKNNQDMENDRGVITTDAIGEATRDVSTQAKHEARVVEESQLSNKNIHSIGEEPEEALMHLQERKDGLEREKEILQNEDVSQKQKLQEIKQNKNRIIELLRNKGDIETLETMFLNILHYNGLPKWLEEMKKSREENESTTEERGVTPDDN